MKDELFHVHGDIGVFMGESERIVINPEPLEAYALRESGSGPLSHTKKGGNHGNTCFY